MIIQPDTTNPELTPDGSVGTQEGANSIRFEDFSLKNELLRAIKEMGYEEPSPIQARAIPVAMAGGDIIGQAQTGTGKTAAFSLPLLNKLKQGDKSLQALILCPTRELAIQVSEEIRKLCRYMHGIKLLPVYGGQDIGKQIRSLKGGISLIIGTPGRIMDHMRRHTIKTENIHTVVLDEADEMLDMGFRDDIETILQDTPQTRQTMLFSATMPRAIMEIAKKYQDDATLIKVVKKELTVPSIDQYYFEVKKKKKEEVLSRLLDIYSPKLSLVFCNTKRQVDELVTALKNRGYFADGIHGDLKQSQRDRVMNAFRSGKTDILVATDVAARGLDIENVEVVFNYDLPQDDEYYVHRIGRTGRAGKTGMSFSFVTGRDFNKLKDIQRYCKTKILAKPVPSIEDVEEIKVEKTLRQISDIIENEDLSKMIKLIERKVNEEDYTSMDMAAAFLKLSLGEKDASPGSEGGGFDFGDTGAETGMVRLFINIGKKNAKPKDILGAIAGESGIPGKLVGAIDMYDKYTFVEVPREYAMEVLNAMNRSKIKGKSVNVEPANQK